VISHSLAHSKVHRRWRAVEIHWKEWDDGILAYNASSGSTHVLNPISAKILKALEKYPANIIEALEQITQDIGPSDDEVLASIEKFVANLEELGLIEPASE
jgi:PqqD family protein of HPr-rel-A system